MCGSECACVFGRFEVGEVECEFFGAGLSFPEIESIILRETDRRFDHEDERFAVHLVEAERPADRDQHERENESDIGNESIRHVPHSRSAKEVDELLDREGSDHFVFNVEKLWDLELHSGALIHYSVGVQKFIVDSLSTVVHRKF
jgi:hypothetical protein